MERTNYNFAIESERLKIMPASYYWFDKSEEIFVEDMGLYIRVKVIDIDDLIDGLQKAKEIINGEWHEC